MNPWIPHLLRAGGGGGGPVLPPAGRTMLANLTSSLILDEGTGGPTWSRPTKAWRFNELGYLEEIASGCAVFGGARLVRTTVRTKSEDFSNAAWVKSNCTVTGTNTIVCANATSLQRISQDTSGAALVTGMKMFYSFRVAYVSGGASFIQITGTTAGFGSGQHANFSLLDGTHSEVGCTASSSLVSPGVYDISCVLTATATANQDAFYACFVNDLAAARFASFTGDGIKSFELLRAWSVDVTNYDASYVPEYVSVGVEASPYFGAGIDGAKYFETDWQGAPIAAANLLRFRREASAINNLLQSRLFQNNVWVSSTTGSDLCVNGDFGAGTGWTTEAGWAIGAGVLTGTATSANTYRAAGIVSGKTYTVSFEIVSRTAGLVSVTVGNQAVSVWRSIAGVYTYDVIGGASGNIEVKSSGFSGVVDNISVKEAAVQCTSVTGLGGIANTATTLTAAAAGAIILQPITLASAARCASAYVKRRTGTGTISFTQDGGSTWTDITSLINNSTWSRVQITATLANPSVGFKISTSGDAIDVDCVQNEAGTVATSPIVTTTAAVTRDADSDTYQTASNWSDTAGTVYIEAQPLAWVAGGAIGSATNGLLLSAANSGATASDGTNTANGPAGSPSGREKLAMRWGGGAMTVASGGVVGTAGTYDGGMGLASVGIAVNSSVYCGRVAIYNYQMTDAELQAITA